MKLAKGAPVYISGPMTGWPCNNASAFEAAAQRLKEAGYRPVSPAKVVLPEGVEPSWENYMREDIRLLVQCQGVCTLYGWRDSRGATIEVDLAVKLGLVVAPLEAWA